MKRLLITGGLGFIGSSLAKHYASVKLFDQIIVLDNLSRGSRENIRGYEDKIQVFIGDLTDKESCVDAFFGIDTVIHLAASVGGISLYENKPFSVAFDNTSIDLNAISLSKQTGVKNFLYASSTHVYPHHLQMTADSRPLVESDAVGGGQYLSYGIEKLYIEKLLESLYKENKGMNIGIARYCGIFGPNQDIDINNASLIPALCHRAALHPIKEYTIRGNGEETRSYCFIDDAVEATALMLLKMDSKGFVGAYNVGSPHKYTVYEIASLIGKISGKDLEPIRDPSIKASIMGQSCSIDAIEMDLGWTPKTLFSSGLEKVYKNVCERIYDE